jgi:hypothetical protein
LTLSPAALTIGGWATIVNIASERLTVKITFLGKDSTPNDSPTLFATDRDTLLVQGYKVTDPEALAAMRLPDNETVVEVPPALMKYLPPDVIKKYLLPEELPDGDGEGRG